MKTSSLKNLAQPKTSSSNIKSMHKQNQNSQNLQNHLHHQQKLIRN